VDDERTPPPPPSGDAAGTGTPPETPSTARRPAPRATTALVAALAGTGLALAAALVAPAVLAAAPEHAAPTTAREPEPPGTTDGPTPPSDDPTDWVQDTTELLRALPGVADVRMDGWSGAAAYVTLDTPLPSPEDAQRTADDAREILVASRGGAVWALHLEGTTPDGATLQVVDGTDPRGTASTPGGPGLLGDDPVAYAVRLLADDGVRAVALDPSSASATVAGTADLARVVDAVRGEGRGLSSVGTTGYGTSLSLGDGTTLPDDALVALVAQTASRPGVTTTSYAARRSELPGTPLLSVVVAGDPAGVARWLDGTTYDADPLGYQVHGTADDGSQAVRSGYVADAVPGLPADGTTCDPALLTLDATGFDAALGRRFLTVTARNDDDAPCVLAGAPALRFVASDGSEQAVLVEPDASVDQGPVTLAPGDVAQSVLSWRGGSTAGGPALVTSLLVAPTPGAPESVVPFADVPGAESGLDLLDGATATVTPWGPWVEPGAP